MPRRVREPASNSPATIPATCWRRSIARLTAFRNKPTWERLMRNGMDRDYSWEGPAREYAAVYEEALRRRA